MTVELPGERVLLRPVEPPDAPLLSAILAQAEVANWWGPEPEGFPFTDDPDATRFAIVVDDEVVGLVQYGEESEPDYRHAWIDIYLDTARHGGGLGREAIVLLTQHLGEALGHHRVTIDPAADNTAAIRCYEKAGFNPVGIMKKAWRHHPSEEWRDVLLMERIL